MQLGGHCSSWPSISMVKLLIGNSRIESKLDRVLTNFNLFHNSIDYSNSLLNRGLLDHRVILLTNKAGQTPKILFCYFNGWAKDTMFFNVFEKGWNITVHGSPISKRSLDWEMWRELYHSGRKVKLDNIWATASKWRKASLGRSPDINILIWVTPVQFQVLLYLMKAHRKRSSFIPSLILKEQPFVILQTLNLSW